jgi:hypothetical protein
LNLKVPTVAWEKVTPMLHHRASNTSSGGRKLQKLSFTYIISRRDGKSYKITSWYRIQELFQFNCFPLWFSDDCEFKFVQKLNTPFSNFTEKDVVGFGWLSWAYFRKERTISPFLLNPYLRNSLYVRHTF